MTRAAVPHRAAALAALATLATLALAGGCSWFDSDKDSKPAELQKIKETLRVKSAWSAGVGSGDTHLRLGLVPATDGTRIFAAGHDGSISAFNAESGRRLWRVGVKAPLSGGPGVGSGHVVVGASNGEVIAVSAEDGHTEWRKSIGSEVLSAPAVGTQAAFVKAMDGRLVALSLADGSRLWFAQQSVPKLMLRGAGAPVLDRDLVICGFDNGHLSAYDARDGSVVWDLLLAPPSGRTEVERLSDLNATPVVAGDDVYAVSYNGRVASVSRATGQVNWSEEVSSYAGVAADIDAVYVAADAGQVVAYSRASGRQLWRREGYRNRDLSAPAAVGGSVVVGDLEGYLHWFDARTGEPQARVSAGGKRVTAAPLVVNGLLFVQTDSGDVYAFRLPAPAGGK